MSSFRQSSLPCLRAFAALTTVAIAISLLPACDQNAPPPDEDTEAAFIPWTLISGRIAYVSAGKLFIIDAAKRSVSQIGPDGSYPGLAWKRDGRQLAFERLHNGQYQLAYLPLEGGEPRPLFDSFPGFTRVIGARAPAWSWDGRIAYEVAGDRGGVPWTEVWVDGEPLYRSNKLCSHDLLWSPTRPAWTPEGNFILVCERTATSEGFYTVDMSGTRSSVLFQVPRNNAMHLLRDPVYSPDGAHIAFTRWLPEENDTAIWTVRTDGSSPLRLAAGSRPSWAPDGKKIVFTGGGGRLFIVSATGGEPIALTRGFGAYPNWIQ